MSTPLELAREWLLAVNPPSTMQPADIRAVCEALIEAEKQREPVEVGRVMRSGDHAERTECGGCHWAVMTSWKFCPNCGHPLKWKKEQA